MFRFKILSLAIFLIAGASVASAATITDIGLGDFADAKVLDFNSATLGSISNTDALFTAFGISSIVGGGTGSGDSFGTRTNSSRALWHNDSGLVIADPGTSSYSNRSSYLLTFADPQSRFGVGTHDENATFRFEFLNGMSTVGVVTESTIGGSADLGSFYWESDMAFNAVLVSIASGSGSGGFAIDNITLESSEVPEPASLALFGMGLAGLGLHKKKQQSA